MKSAAQKLLKQSYPNESIGGKIADVKVSVDGTWQRRGHCSKLGVKFIISIDTGDVLDFEIKNLYCHQCQINKNVKSKVDFEQWYQNHKEQCTVNHEGSSGAMLTQTTATSEMF